jgi:hypothetical protein
MTPNIINFELNMVEFRDEDEEAEESQNQQYEMMMKELKD